MKIGLYQVDQLFQNIAKIRQIGLNFNCVYLLICQSKIKSDLIFIELKDYIFWIPLPEFRYLDSFTPKIGVKFGQFLKWVICITNVLMIYESATWKIWVWYFRMGYNSVREPCWKVFCQLDSTKLADYTKNNPKLTFLSKLSRSLGKQGSFSD